MTDKKTTSWFVYIIEANDHSLYTGITTDVDRRFQEHCGNTAGARYFNGRKPVEVVYREGGHNRSTASKRESEIKKLGRQQKLVLIGAQFTNPEQT